MNRSNFAATRHVVTVAILLASLGRPAPVTAAPSAADGTLHLGELSFRLPDPTWSLASASPGAQAVQLEKTANLHEQYLVVNLAFADPLYTRGEATTRALDGAQRVQLEGYKTSDYRRGERTIGGAAYGTLAFRAARVNGSPSPVDDITVLVWTPPDFESRHTICVLAWTDEHSASVAPVDPSDLDALVQSLALPPLGTTLLHDDFQDPGATLFGSSSNSQASTGLVDGEYAFQITDPDFNGGMTSPARGGTFANVVVAADVRTASDEPGQVATLACRYAYGPTAGHAGYQAAVDLGTGSFQIRRLDKNRLVDLMAWKSAESFAADGTPVHLELACVGNTITVSVNGGPGVSVHDSKYLLGLTGIGGGTLGDVPGQADVRFGTFDVRQA